MTVTVNDAKAAAVALAKAAVECPVRQLRYELVQRANEWHRAAEWADEYPDDEAVIELVGTVIPGMFVMDDDQEYPERRVIRVLSRDGVSLHLDNPRSPAGTYRNYSHPTSPVVVKA